MQRKKRARKNPKLKYANFMPNQHLSLLPPNSKPNAFPSPPCHQNQIPDHFEAASDKGQNASNLTWKYHNGQKNTKSHKNTPLCHKPHTFLQWTMRVHSVSPAFFDTTSLPTLHHTTNPNPRLNPSITITSFHVTSNHSAIYGLAYFDT